MVLLVGARLQPRAFLIAEESTPWYVAANLV
jgi:hypothetical protein